MIRVTLLCGRVLSGRTLWRLLTLELRLDWPATEWATGPEPKMACEMACEMAGSHFVGESPKMAGQMARQLKFGEFCISGHWPGHSSAILEPPPTKWPPAISPAISRPFWVLGRFASLWEGPVASGEVWGTCRKSGEKKKNQ